MKIFFALMLIVSSYCGFAKGVSLANNGKEKMTRAEVVPVKDASKTELYSRARFWFADAFNAAHEVILLNDKVAGVLMGKGFQEIFVETSAGPESVKLWYSVTLTVKNNSYKYVISDIYFENDADNTLSNGASNTEVAEVLNDLAHGSFADRTFSKAPVESVEKLILALQAQIKAGMATSVIVRSGGFKW